MMRYRLQIRTCLRLENMCDSTKITEKQEGIKRAHKLIVVKELLLKKEREREKRGVG